MAPAPAHGSIGARRSRSRGARKTSSAGSAWVCERSKEEREKRLRLPVGLWAADRGRKREPGPQELCQTGPKGFRLSGIKTKYMRYNFGGVIQKEGAVSLEGQVVYLLVSGIDATEGWRY